MALIAIEEHWNLPALTSAVKALPEDHGDPSALFDEMGDNLERQSLRARPVWPPTAASTR